jgi:pantoate--beta-alanine ligase
MKVVRSVAAMQRVCRALKRRGRRIGFVPTMGSLHAGHLALVARARRLSDVVVVSVFVNPMQFNNRSDRKNYPRDTAGDLRKLRGSGVDLAFLPQAKDLYPEGFQTSVVVAGVTQGLCGTARPGHFCGVTTIVLKLFSIVSPDVAVFGKKDYQQYVTVRTMVRDLNLPVRIAGCEMVREKDGLAMSSRNARIPPGQRRHALVLSRALFAARQGARQGQRDTAALIAQVKRVVRAEKGLRLDYVECRHVGDLRPLRRVMRGKTLLALAANIGKVRLIDNIVF